MVCNFAFASRAYLGVHFNHTISFSILVEIYWIFIFSGRTGSFCICCSASPGDIHDVTKIAEGFYMDVGTKELWDTFEGLAKLHNIPESDWGEWEIPSERGDYESRLGLKSAPVTSEFEVTKIMSILHAARLRAFVWVLELIIRWAAKCLQWGEGAIPPSTKDRLEKCRKEVRKKLGPLLGFRDRKCPNQVTGALADLFFSEKNRDNLINMVESLTFWRKSYRRAMSEADKINLRRLVQGLAVMGRVGTSGQLVKVFNLRNYGIELHLFIQETWPWILLGESVHR